MRLPTFIATGVLAGALLAGPASAQSVSGGVTRWNSVAKAVWPAGAARRALIIGNATYRDPSDDSETRPISLHNLASACDDAELVAKSLARGGWRADEIALACDQTSDDVDDALRHLLAALPQQALPGQVTIIYLAGHGVQIGGRSYFFGVNARPDFGAAADTVLDSDGRELFGTDATNPVGQLGKLGRYAPSAVLLVIDACRDDPVFDQARLRLNERYRERYHLSDKDIARLAQGAITAPSLVGTSPPEGAKVLFASDDGAMVDDSGAGAGQGRLAAALADHLARDMSLNEAVSSAATDVIQATTGLRNGAVQTPRSFGNLKGNPCVTSCTPAVPAARAIRLKPVPGQAAPLKLRPATFFQTSTDQTAAAEAAFVQRSSTTLDRPIRGALGRTVEIFWCAIGDIGDKGRFDQAMHLGQNLANLSSEPALAGVAMVRVTRLEPQENALGANRSNADVVRFETADSQLASRVVGTMPGLSLEQRRIGIEGYLPIYFCRGAYDGPQPTTLYMQVPDRGGLNAASKVLAELPGRFPDVDVIPQAEVLPTKSPDHSQLRFYDPSRKAEVGKIASEVSRILGVPVKPVLFSRLANPRRMKLLELWVGRRDNVGSPINGCTSCDR